MFLETRGKRIQNSVIVYLLVSQFLAKVGHDVTELGSADETIAVLVEHSEGFPDLLLAEKSTIKYQQQILSCLLPTQGKALLQGDGKKYKTRA